ncbi:ComEA family DNA-binding protein [Paenibacillus radicibacter]|uniref:ComEA family DNA-binding protein n=1 Tax=Paenibacillus radicibacter TaxID=2972488 RepID=UPI002158BE67|nr:helix-hairpin-helix domain-containing protein [Paenibacillus radicibacter]
MTLWFLIACGGIGVAIYILVSSSNTNPLSEGFKEVNKEMEVLLKQHGGSKTEKDGTTSNNPANSNQSKGTTGTQSQVGGAGQASQSGSTTQGGGASVQQGSNSNTEASSASGSDSSRSSNGDSSLNTNSSPSSSSSQSSNEKNSSSSSKSSAAASTTNKSGKINLNTATATQLETLPGIGPSKSQAILDHRKKIGGFKSVKELDSVKGIGEKMLAKIEPLVYVD